MAVGAACSGATVALGVGVAVALGVALGVSVGVGVPVALGVGVAVLVAVGVGVGVGVLECEWPPNRPVERLSWPTLWPNTASSDAVTTPAAMKNASRPVSSAIFSGRRLRGERSGS